MLPVKSDPQDPKQEIRNAAKEWLIPRLSPMARRNAEQPVSELVREIYAKAQKIFSEICWCVQLEASKTTYNTQVCSNAHVFAVKLFPLVEKYLKFKYSIDYLNYRPESNISRSSMFVPDSHQDCLGASYLKQGEEIFTHAYITEWDPGDFSKFTTRQIYQIPAVTFSPIAGLWETRTTDPAEDTFTLVCGKTEEKVHILFLKRFAPFFEKLMLSEMKEVRARRVELKQIEPAAMQEAIHFMYHGKTEKELFVTDWVDLYEVGKMWLFDPLKDFCVGQIYTWVNDNPIDERNFCLHLQIAFEIKTEGHLHGTLTYLEETKKWTLLSEVILNEWLDPLIEAAKQYGLSDLKNHLLEVFYQRNKKESSKP